jgi:thioredoxin 1
MMKHALLAALLSISVGMSGNMPRHINAIEFSTLIGKGNGIILDVRTPGEFARGHIENSTLISTTDPQFAKKVNLLQKDKPIYVYCLTGSRSNAVANYMARNGFTNVYNLQRGIMEWQQRGLPITKSSHSVAADGKSYTVEGFKSIMGSNNLVLADFYAAWCAPCKKMAPEIEKLKQQYAGKARIEKIDIESNPALQNAYGVQSVPTLILFKNGKEVWRHNGYLDHASIQKELIKHL